MKPHTPLVLIILDGWGHAEHSPHNAITNAYTPVWKQLWKNFPHTLIEGSGPCVGLPKDQMGNSEVGHLHMGAGRLVMQDLQRIDQAIESGEFQKNPILNQLVDEQIEAKAALHIMGLLSDGGVHSHDSHLAAMVALAANKGLEKIYVHAFLDGRDTPPKSALDFINQFEKALKKIGKGKIVSVVGRYYAMDRDQRWERTQQAYDMLTSGTAPFQADTAKEAIELAYARNETDEFVQPTLIHATNEAPITVKNNDAIIFMNFRADRARQLSRAFTQTDFKAFKRACVPKLNSFVTLTEYASDIPARVVYQPISLKNHLGEYLAAQGYRQLRIAETEKYAHVTFFFNGGIEQPYPHEERILIPSPKVATYDLQPEMSAYELTDQLVKAIASKKYEVIICNFANPDMIGHTGNFSATMKAIETIDQCLARIIETLHTVGGEAVITADHGNAECMFDNKTKQPHTAHTTNLVPVIYFGRDATPTTQKGVLYDIGPTLIYLLGLQQPAEMTGHTLFKIQNEEPTV